jgi:transposase
VPTDDGIAKEHKLVRIVRRMMRILRKARYPHRRSKFSNDLYSDRQHIMMLVLRQHFAVSYRDFCEVVGVCTLLNEELKLRSVPHWTTLQKFSSRTETRGLECLDLAVDSTGFSPTSASEYYVRTIEARRGHMVKHCLKQTVAVETRKQLIAAVKFRLGPTADSPDFIPVLKKASIARQSIRIAVADKGYDAERNHEFVQVVLGARTAIPVSAASRPGLRILGRRRRMQTRRFDSIAYNQRAKIETVHSSVKRTMGSHVLARRVGERHKELVLRCLAHNVRRIETLFLALWRISTELPARMRFPSGKVIFPTKSTDIVR